MKGISRPHYMSPVKPVKCDLKNLIKLGVVLLLFGVLILGILELTTKPKTPATSEQVWDIIVAQGYEPEDITAKYYEQDPESKSRLLKCIAFEKNDIHFKFFELNDDNMAINIYSQFHARIIANYNASHIIETENKKANFVIYTLDNEKKYNVAIYVGNTAVYACCDSENKAEIQKILDAIDYLKA